MELPLKYRLICEGPSERTYIQRLSSLLSDALPLMRDGYTPRLSFFPKVTNNKIGGGSFKLVRRAYREFAPCDKKVPMRIWVDCDIYIRNDGDNEKACAVGYANKGTMPDFNFSVMNYEDFLALHFPDNVFERWKAEMTPTGHFTVPLHGEAYAPHFALIWECLQMAVLHLGEYRKGDLFAEFLTIESLGNMIRHAEDPMLKRLFAAHSPAGAFPIVLSNLLKMTYPEVFGK